MVNVTGYINKGKDAAAKGNLATLLVSGAVFFDLPAATYTGFGVSADFNKVKNALTAAGYTMTPLESSTAWCAHVPLKSITGNYCVDSSGNKKEGTTICTAQACN